MTDIESCISNFVSDLSALVKEQALASVTDALNGSGHARTDGRRRPANIPPRISGRTTSGRTSSGRTSGARHRTSAADVAKQKDAVLAAAKKLKPDFNRAAIIKATGLEESASRMLSLLVADKKLKKKGDRRGTTYTVV